MAHLSPRLWRVTLAVAAVAAAVICVALWQGWEHRYFLHHLFYGDVEIDRSRYPVLGIDVSSHNGHVGFQKVASDSITFVYVKCSEGEDFRDSLFDINVQRAQQAGLKVGAYHYFRKGVSGVRQASNMLDAVVKHNLDLPLAVDVEDYGNNNSIDDATTIRQLRDMLMALSDVGHVNVVIYTNGKGYDNYIKYTSLPKHFLWYCAFKQPDEVKGKHHTLQQYSHYGKVRGVRGDVDLDVFVGSKTQWDEWLNEVKPPTILKL